MATKNEVRYEPIIQSSPRTESYQFPTYVAMLRAVEKGLGELNHQFIRFEDNNVVVFTPTGELFFDRTVRQAFYSYGAQTEIFSSTADDSISKSSPTTQQSSSR